MFFVDRLNANFCGCWITALPDQNNKFWVSVLSSTEHAPLQARYFQRYLLCLGSVSAFYAAAIGHGESSSLPIRSNIRKNWSFQRNKCGLNNVLVLVHRHSGKRLFIRTIPCVSGRP